MNRLTASGPEPGELKLPERSTMDELTAFDEKLGEDYNSLELADTRLPPSPPGHEAPLAAEESAAVYSLGGPESVRYPELEREAAPTPAPDGAESLLERLEAAERMLPQDMGGVYI